MASVCLCVRRSCEVCPLARPITGVSPACTCVEDLQEENAARQHEDARERAYRKRFEMEGETETFLKDPHPLPNFFDTIAVHSLCAIKRGRHELSFLCVCLSRLTGLLSFSLDPTASPEKCCACSWRSPAAPCLRRRCFRRSSLATSTPCSGLRTCTRLLRAWTRRCARRRRLVRP